MRRGRPLAAEMAWHLRSLPKRAK